MRISIVTLNLYGVPFSHLSTRLNKICNTINRFDVDFISLQQVHTYDVVWQLKRRLPVFKYVSFKPSLLGPQAGLVILSKRPLYDEKLFQFNQANRIFGINVKGALAAQTSTGLAICNTHLSANLEGDWSDTSKYYSMHKEQLTKLGNVIKDYAAHTPIIIAGDFNIAGDSNVFQGFVREVGLKDAFAGDFRPTFHKEFLPSGEPGRRIDQILVTEGSVIKTLQLFDELISFRGVKLAYLSDHMGLYASIEIQLRSMKP